MTRRYRTARPEEHRALMVQDAQAFGDSTTSVSIDRSVARTRVEELRVLEEDGNRLGLLLARGQPVLALGPAGKQVPAALVKVNQKLLVADAQLGKGFGERRGHGNKQRHWQVTTESVING